MLDAANEILLFLILLGFFAGGACAIWLAIRKGIRARFFFTFDAFGFPVIFLVGLIPVTAIRDWILGEDGNWTARLWSMPAILAIYTAFYAVGFLLGSGKRRRNRGIVSLGDY